MPRPLVLESLGAPIQGMFPLLADAMPMLKLPFRDFQDFLESGYAPRTPFRAGRVVVF